MFDEWHDALRAALVAVPDDPSDLSDEQASDGFARLQQASELLEAKRMRWLADQDRRASFRRDGYLSLAAWLSDRHRVAAGAAKNQVKVAAALEAMPGVRQAFSAGEVSSSAVRVLADAQAENPDAFATQEAALVDSAMTNGVEELRRVVADWSQAVDQEQAVAAGERRLVRRRIDICPAATGMVRVEGELDPESGEAVLAAVNGIVDAELRYSPNASGPRLSVGPMLWRNWPVGTCTHRTVQPWPGSDPTLR